MPQNTKSGKGFFIGLLAGGAVGSVVALLTTPKSGANMRNDIKQKSDEYFDEVAKYFSETKLKFGKAIDESRRTFATILHDIKSKPEAMYKDAKGKTVEVFNSGKEIVETEKEKLTSSVKAGIEAFNNERK